ncbi:DUF5718 family protein [Thiomicrorhabdus sediminis]|uniref:Uncharacterized protein n=1 Tax=Thiomicrorhabdus sediminis TaxID=2580412 RepID=A0A4P9K4Q9_9GAMM|nr:DUF5718 family protein [Thiomicrorhabdus sediminis]QCU89721.1 hypothetical protein FE785_03230 [Thiomicrorhabdus sediminis]
MTQFTLSKQTLENLVGLGVAGNFAGHLEQAGETPDFVNVKTTHSNAPKGLFPYYIPNNDEQIGVFPWSASQIRYPQNLAENAHLQAEPEVCVLFDVTYQNNQVQALSPKAFAAFNDCSIRKPGAKKISEKKNWGADTKGMANEFIALDSFAAGCELDNFRIASFLKRDGEYHAYGKDSSVLTYSYFHQQLSDWMIDRLNKQADFGPLEDLNAILKDADYPKQVLISLGATTYTEFGETVFLQPGDEVFIYVYDATQNSSEDVQKHLHGELDNLIHSSALHQKIV